MRGFETALNSEIDLLMTRLAGIADGKTTVSMMEEFNHLTLDIIGKVIIMSSIRWFNSTSWSQWRFKLTHIIMSSIRWFNSTRRKLKLKLPG
jgi:hypothetical protein